MGDGDEAAPTGVVGEDDVASLVAGGCLSGRIMLAGVCLLFIGCILNCQLSSLSRWMVLWAGFVSGICLYMV